MAKTNFSEVEILLCTYAAKHNFANDIGPTSLICQIDGKRLSSIKTKIRRIASLVAYQQTPARPHLNNLRFTNYDWVNQFRQFERLEFRRICLDILQQQEIL